MNVILVGGSGDGKRIALPDGVTKYDLVVTEWTSAMSNIRLETYQQFPLRSSLERLHVFACVGMAWETVIEKLLDGYYPLGAI